MTKKVRLNPGSHADKDVQHSSLNLTFVNIVQVKNLSRSNSYMESVEANFRLSRLNQSESK